MAPRFGSKLRYFAGKGSLALLDFLLKTRLMPFSRRFPVGWRFEHDLTRFLNGPPTVVLDAGANIGQTALRFNRYWKNAKVFSFEPVSSTYEQLSYRCRSLKNIECVNCALGDENKRVEIILDADSERNSLLHLAHEDFHQRDLVETVSMRRLDDFAGERQIHQIDLLKIDVEGFEIQVLEGAARLLREGRVRAIYAECGLLRNDDTHVHFADIDQYLYLRSFVFSGIYEIFRWGPERRFPAFANGLWLHAA